MIFNPFTRKTAALLLAMGIIVLAGNRVMAQKNNPVPAQSPTQPNTLLWKVSGNGLQKPSYVFGTMHILCASDIRLSEQLRNTIRDVDKIYFEVDMDDMMEMVSVMSYVRMNNNVKISDLLTEKEYARLKDYFAHHQSGIPLQMMEGFKPFFISSIIEEQTMTCTDKKGMEQLIMNEASQYKKEIKGLESMKFQASVFDSIPYKEQAKGLVASLDSLEAGNKQTQELIEVYKQQDLRKIEELSSKEDPGMDKYMDLLLYNRNKDWITKISNITTGGSYLFAVGAAHLVGPRGVLNLLKEKGYTVTPVENSFK